MKTTLLLAALSMTLSATAYAQEEYEGPPPGPREPGCQNREGAPGPEFRGPPPPQSRDKFAWNQRRGYGRGPVNPEFQRQRPSGPPPQNWGRGQGPQGRGGRGGQWGGQGRRGFDDGPVGPRFGAQRPPGPPPQAWNRGYGSQGRGGQGQQWREQRGAGYGRGPMNRQSGPQWRSGPPQEWDGGPGEFQQGRRRGVGGPGLGAPRGATAQGRGIRDGQGRWERPPMDNDDRPARRGGPDRERPDFEEDDNE